jgi:hypothetical protein
MFGRITFFAAALAASLLAPAMGIAAGAANDHTVLILASTAAGGVDSKAAQIVRDLGYDVELATDAQWTAKSTADFATYRAIVLADPDCAEGTTPVAAAEANTSVWGPAVDGNIYVVGTDPVFHSRWQPGASQLIESGLEYVLSTPKTEGKTGLYVSLSCYFNKTGDNNEVELLSYFGTFIVNDNETCHDDIHITAPTHPAMADLTDASLSNWDCSIHELFSAWPSSFMPVAIAEGLGTGYTAPDGSVGTPYLFARNAITTTCSTMPTLSINSISPSTLWSPNNKMVDVAASVTTTGTLVNVTRTITSSETPSESKSPVFENGSDIYHFKLRASRNGNNKAGRTYTITFTGTDACGNIVSKSTTVFVPHDQGKSLK